MLAEWAAGAEQPILPTSTNPCIAGAAGTQRVNLYAGYIHEFVSISPNHAHKLVNIASDGGRVCRYVASMEGM